MSNEEVKTFNVKNNSVRLVHIGAVFIAPEQIKSLVDDEAGINRKSIEDLDYLVITDEETEETEEVKKATRVAARTASGAGWTSK